ncbi:putative efflux protein, MATE family [Sphaerochaeta pleomorpha str. Grapes]|uniref:Multidrug-efflux transporter n=1 Tax=Sphaerochaeta pleomorpha (strain ATCC BAA-1885 / DSM 22778 / Grapes) TaxID=158190 RepID=G8QSM6_SPHPG|nr:MATE family efflux transporter [Sphaerochaeta pleomorpha]AEV28987.1 putative efflux protein, MATE family [Sphaerochaeta pleomorpha str. Grapes]
MLQKQENKMGILPVPRLVLSMSIPIMISMLIQALYNIVDSMFVARVSEEALTAVSLAFPIQNLVIAVAIGTSIGINSLLSRSLGAKNIETAEKAANNGIVLGLLSWIVFAILGLTLSKNFFALFTDNPTLLKMGTQYISVCLVFSLGIFIDITCERILQATGDTIHPMIIQSIGAISNIILDPIMIFGLFGFPALGIFGAAIATVISQHISALLAIYYVRRNTEVQIQARFFKLEKKIVLAIYAVGIPTIIMQAIGTLMVTSLNKIIIGYGISAVAVFGIYFKVQSFIFMPVFGLNSGMIPVIGFNYGAKQPKRIMEALKVGISISVSIMAIGMFIFLAFPHVLLSWFNASPEMLAIGIVALPRISLCFLSAGICIVLGALFQATGDGYISMIISITRQMVFLLPSAYFLGKFFGLDAIWFSFIIAESSSFFLSLFFFKQEYTKKLKPLYVKKDPVLVETEETRS